MNHRSRRGKTSMVPARDKLRGNRLKYSTYFTRSFVICSITSARGSHECIQHMKGWKIGLFFSFSRAISLFLSRFVSLESVKRFVSCFANGVLMKIVWLLITLLFPSLFDRFALVSLHSFLSLSPAFCRRIAVLRHCCQALSFALCALCTPNRIMKMCTKHRRQESKSNHYTSVRLQLVTVTEKSLKQNGIIAENHQLRKHSRAQRCKKIQPKSLWEHQNQHGNKWTTTKSANTSNTATESVNEKRKKKHP